MLQAKQTRLDLAEICNHGNFRRRPWISFPPGGGGRIAAPVGRADTGP